MAAPRTSTSSEADAARRRELAPNGWPAELLRGFKAGERGALTQVYRMHAEDVGLLLRRGFSFESGGQRHRFVGYGSGFELQDVLHETFRRAFEPKARASYDGIRPYGAYVSTIARNLVLRSFRRRERLFPLSAQGESLATRSPTTLGGSDPRPSPEREIHDAQVRELVATFLAQLEPSERRLVELRYVEGQSQRDAATELGLGRQRVRTQEKALRRKLLSFLRAHGETALVDGVVASVGLPALVSTELLRALLEVAR